MKSKLSVSGLVNALVNSWYALKLMWAIQKWLYILSGLVYFIQGMLPLVNAYLAGRVIDSLISAAGSGTIGRRLIILIIIAAVSQFFYMASFNIQTYLQFKMRMTFEVSLTDKMFKKIIALDHYHYESSQFHKLTNKVQLNINVISWLPHRVFQFGSSVTQLVVTLIAILTLNPLIVLMLIVGSLPYIYVLTRSAKERWKVWEDIDEDYRLVSAIEENVLNTQKIGEVKIFSLSSYLRNIWKKYYGKAITRLFQVESRASKGGVLSYVIEAFVELGIYIWLAIRVITSAAFSIGSFEFYRRMISDFSSASGRLAAGFQDLNESTLYINDFRELMKLRPRVKQVKNPIRIDAKKLPKIQFKNVSFKYPGSNKYVLKKLNITIQPGEDIALVGENGAGKTTIIKLLMRFYDVTDGQILIDGKDIKKIGIESWYQQIGVLFQNFNHYEYFKAYRSIGVGNSKQVNNLEQIEEMAKLAGADKTIQSLPEGFNTVLSKSFSKGTDLSGGQWQRVALARAFFRNANILILDEPTASIDAQGEYEIFKRISETQADKTTIIISHRFSTVRKADKIYVIENGKIAEHGSHEELMKMNNGTYKHMFELQAEGYK